MKPEARRQSEAVPTVEQLQLESLSSLIRTLKNLGVPDAKIRALLPPGHPLSQTLQLMVTAGGPRGNLDAGASGAAQARLAARHLPQPVKPKPAAGIQPQLKVDPKPPPKEIYDDLALAILKMAHSLLRSITDRRRRKEFGLRLGRSYRH